MKAKLAVKPFMTPRRWKTARKIVQIVALMAFGVLFVLARRGGWPAELVNVPLRLDPLAMLAQMIASRTLLAGSALALIIVLLTLALGRAWCGWLCPLGTLIDLFPVRRMKLASNPSGQKNLSGLRNIKYGLLFTILFAALFANLTLLIFDPLTIVFRTFTTSLWPAMDRLISAAEAALYTIPFLQQPLSAFDEWVRPMVLPVDPAYYRDAALFLGLLVGLIALNYFAPRFWCRYLCPLGGLLGLLSKVGLVRREVKQANCTGCDACARVCPTGTIAFGSHGASDPSECTMCLECLTACPRDGAQFVARLTPAKWQSYDPNRRQMLASVGMAAVGAGLVRSEVAARRDDLHLIRPPGARENDLLSKCIRCGECMRACPTSGLQPALGESGLEGIWTPVLLPRIGYCDYSCNACGQVCPVQAIPPLSLEEKRTRVNGKAYIDQNRCIAWADHRDCIVCEEMCPLPEKAIKLDVAQVQNATGETVTVKLPHVNRQACIGCGICEYKCPLNGEAAIRVYAPTTDPLG
jgi:polyferredoxin